jgi:hypothetical protein
MKWSQMANETTPTSAVHEAQAVALARRKRRAWAFVLFVSLGLLFGLGFGTPTAAASTGAELERRQLTVIDWARGDTRSIEVVQLAQGNRVSLWVESGRPAATPILLSLLTRVDEAVYPALSSALGDDLAGSVAPGRQVQIVLYDFGSETIAGYFSPADLGAGGLLPPHVEQGLGRVVPSNGGRFVYLDLSAVMVDPGRAPALAAHEIAHLLLFLQDRSRVPTDFSMEHRWVQEGVAVYAEMLAGYPEALQSALLSLTVDPTFSLSDWRGFRRDYGAAGSFVAYLTQRTGPGFLRALATAPRDGRQGIEDALREVGSEQDFEQLFGAWLLTLLLDGALSPVPPYSLEGLDARIVPGPLDRELPAALTAEIPAYGSLFLQLPADSDRLRVIIRGQVEADLHGFLVTPGPLRTEPPTFTPLRFSGPANVSIATTPIASGGSTLVVWALGPEQVVAKYRAVISVARESHSYAQFLDVDSTHHFFPYIEHLAGLGLLSGREEPAGSHLRYFHPDAPVLRAQFTKLIVGAYGLHTDELEPWKPSFTDVSPLDPYPGDYVYEAREKGLVMGFPDGSFRPWAALTRVQLVRMIVRGAQTVGRPLAPHDGRQQVFADVPPGDPSYPEIMAAFQAGVLTGGFGDDGRRYFWPHRQATRGHVAKMTANLLTEPGDASGMQ